MQVKDTDILKKLLLQEEPEAEVLPQGFEDDPMGFILKKYPGLNTVMEYMMTKDFREFVDAIFVVAPKPTTFKVLLHNGQYFFLQFMGKAYQATVLGKNYYLMSIGEKERCMLAIARLLRYGPPLKTKGPESGEEGTRPEGDTGGGEESGGETSTETGGETGGEGGEEQSLGESLTNRKILSEILKSVLEAEEDSKEEKDSDSDKTNKDNPIKTHEELIKKVLKVKEIPTPKTQVELGTNFTLKNDKDKAIWKELFPIAAASKSGQPSKSSGNGEVAVAWLFSGQGKKVEDTTGGDNPDLKINGIGVEVKAYGKDRVVLGKFAKDTESVKILNTVFGIYSLVDAISKDSEESSKKKETPHNTNNFSMEALIKASEKFKGIDGNTTLRELNIDIIKIILSKIDAIKIQLGLKGDYSQEDLAYQISKKILTNKLSSKPGLGGYILDCKPDGEGKFTHITQESINNLDWPKIKSAFSVNSAQISIDYKKLFDKENSKK